MTTGVLIFAFNNADIDYLGLARESARRIRRHLNLPTCVITDQDVQDSAFDKIIHIATPQEHSERFFDDVGHSVAWRNHGRVDAYDLSPWDRTLLLDADYVVASDFLRSFTDSPQEFLCYKDAWDVTTGALCDSLNSFGEIRFPMWWATVMIFSRTQYCQYLFECMKMVKENWDHYRHLYKTGRSFYRNDFALSVAVNILSGHTLNVPEIPSPLFSVMPDHTVSKISQDCFRIDFKDSNKRPRYTICNGIDLHVMGKKNLGEVLDDQS